MKRAPASFRTYPLNPNSPSIVNRTPINPLDSEPVQTRIVNPGAYNPKLESLGKPATLAQLELGLLLAVGDALFQRYGYLLRGCKSKGQRNLLIKIPEADANVRQGYR